MTGQYQIGGRATAEIVASVEAGIRDGALAPGESLPPVRELATRLGVSPTTVGGAYRTLRQRGLVETAGRHGTRVRRRPPVALPRASRRLPPPPGVPDLSTGEPDVRLLPAIGPQLRTLADQLPWQAGGSTSGAEAGMVAEFAEAARARFAADGVPVNVPGRPAAIGVAHGALDAIERVLGAQLRPGDRVAVEDPGWANLYDLLAALGLEPVGVAVDDNGPIPDGLARALAVGARAAVVTSRAHNPTGAAVTPERAAALREVLAERPGVLVIEDDHAAELAEVPLSPLVGGARPWAFVRSVSKPYGPDLRLAVCAGDEVTMARVAGRFRAGAGWVSTLVQRLTLQLWRDPAVARTVADAAASYRRRRAGLCTELRERGLAAHGRTGINVWVPVPDETQVIARLREAGYVVAPGALSRLDSGPGIRITVGRLAEEELPALADAVAVAVAPGATAGY